MTDLSDLREMAAVVAQQGQRVYVEADTPTVLVGNSYDGKLQLQDADTREVVKFYAIDLLQVEVAGNLLAPGDTVTLRIYRRDRRREPGDIVAEYTGITQVKGMWKAAFVEQHIGYIDMDMNRPSGDSFLHIRVTNATGNSRASDFRLFFLGVVLAKSA